jgi:glycosyltransferase involved in cell wall biosynthesis
VVTDKERDTLFAIAPEARIEVVQNGVDKAALQAEDPPADVPTVVFCGVMNYPPNEAAAVWLARDIWPLVRVQRPDARLQLVGSSPTRAVRQLANERAAITVTGAVPDVRPYLWQAAVAAAPLLTARGVQNKVLEAVAAGLPTVVTPVVLDGLPKEVRPACLVADGTDAFAAALIELFDLSPSERRARTDRVDWTLLSWEKRLKGVGDILAAAVRAPRCSAASSRNRSDDKWPDGIRDP